MAEIMEQASDKELEAMFAAGLQFGYSRSRRHPKMADFIYGTKNNVEVFGYFSVMVNNGCARFIV